MSGWKKQTGFTIVELLIVIVVIGILAGLVMTSFSKAQSRARDAKRSNDVAALVKALEVYKANNGQYPVATSTGGTGSFESTREADGTFMEYMVPAYFSKTPVDPINDSTHYWRYYRYLAGSYGCPVERGAFYILDVFGYENAANKPTSDDPLVCPSRTWGTGSGPGANYLFKVGFENG